MTNLEKLDQCFKPTPVTVHDAKTGEQIGKPFESISKAARTLNIRGASISNTLTGRQKSVKNKKTGQKVFFKKVEEK